MGIDDDVLGVIVIDMITELPRRREINKMCGSTSERWIATRYARGRLRDAYRICRAAGVDRASSRYIVTAGLLVGL